MLNNVDTQRKTVYDNYQKVDYLWTTLQGITKQTVRSNCFGKRCKLKKPYLVTQELPITGMSESIIDYRKNLEAKGYNRYQSSGSLGGSVKGRSVTILNGRVIRN